MSGLFGSPSSPPPIVATMPTLVEGSRLHFGAIIALLVVIGATIVLGRTLKGFEIKLVGEDGNLVAIGQLTLDVMLNWKAGVVAGEVQQIVDRAKEFFRLFGGDDFLGR